MAGGKGQLDESHWVVHSYQGELRPRHHLWLDGQQVPAVHLRDVELDTGLHHLALAPVEGGNVREVRISLPLLRSGQSPGSKNGMRKPQIPIIDGDLVL